MGIVSAHKAPEDSPPVPLECQGAWAGVDQMECQCATALMAQEG